jgi:hypothetical protein
MSEIVKVDQPNMDISNLSGANQTDRSAARFQTHFCQTDSMEPWLRSYRDIAIVDTEVTEIYPGVYLVRFGESEVLRRMEPIGGSKVRLSCDNQFYEAEVCDRALAAQAIVGRVVGRVCTESEEVLTMLTSGAAHYGGCQ